MEPGPDVGTRAAAAAAVSLEATVDAYCAAWNKDDPAVRVAALQAVLTDGARYTDPRADTAGAEALGAHIGTIRAARPGASVLRTTAVDAHHDRARFGFRVTGADGSVLLEGVDVVELAPDGRLARITGFFGDLEGQVRRLWEDAFNRRDLDVLDAVTAPGFVNRNALPGTPPGPVGHRAVFERLWSALPDARFTIDRLARDGDTVLCTGTMSGTHAGTLLGIAATGRAVAWRQCHLYRFDAEGRAVEHDAIRDDMGLLGQMGATG